MNYEVLFDDSVVEDLDRIQIYETKVLESAPEAESRVYALIDDIIESLAYMPARNPAKAYGFDSSLRRACTVGKYVAFYWIDEAAATVHVEKVAHSRSDFSRLRFGS